MPKWKRIRSAIKLKVNKTRLGFTKIKQKVQTTWLGFSKICRQQQRILHFVNEFLLPCVSFFPFFSVLGDVHNSNIYYAVYATPLAVCERKHQRGNNLSEKIFIADVKQKRESLQPSMSAETSSSMPSSPEFFVNDKSFLWKNSRFFTVHTECFPFSVLMIFLRCFGTSTTTHKPWQRQ